MRYIHRSRGNRISRVPYAYLLILFSLSMLIAVLINVLGAFAVRNERILEERQLEIFRNMDLSEENEKIAALCKKNPYFRKTYETLMNEKKYFPVPAAYMSLIAYEDSWGGERTYGGNRRHEGCDIMSLHNIRGEIPVVSMTDGSVENIGWLKLGGYRIGIRSNAGIYYYYAHLDHFADGIKKGDAIKAGQLIGFMGDTGYSEIEGTTGKFDVHLHLGIYVSGKDKEDVSVNPYWIMKTLQNSTK